MRVWNFQVEDELDSATFEAAHETRQSKSEFVRDAVRRRLEEMSGVVAKVVAENKAKKEKWRIGK